MIRSFYTVNRNMNILQKKQENTSANISNINTPGYKFQNMVVSTLETCEMVNHAGGNGLNKRQVLGSFAFGNQIDDIYTQFDQGVLHETGSVTDFAIIGRGFFTVENSDGETGYTRNGNFMINGNNELVTMEGNKVLGKDDNGEIGYVYGTEINEGKNLLITDFTDYTGLHNIGGTIYTGDNEYVSVDSDVRRGFLEMSNAIVGDELIRMMEAARQFEVNQKLLHTADESLNKAVNEVGRV